MAPSKDHDCERQAYAKILEQKLDTVMQRVAQLEKHVVGPQTEKRKRDGKMPRLAPATSPTKQPAKRPAQRAMAVATEVVPVSVPDGARCCTSCGSAELKTVGADKSSTVYEYVASHFRCRVYKRETLACGCGKYIVTAAPPDRVGDRTQYAPSFVAHVVVAKCADNRAQYDLAKEYARAGVPMTRSTLNGLFHRAGSALEPMVAKLFARIAATELVLADETSMRIQTTAKRAKRAFIWTFVTENLIGYRFSADRSGATPALVLGDSEGKLDLRRIHR